MISMNNLGSNGRLGNQMFQYAILKGLSAKYGYEFCIPPSAESNPYYDHVLFTLFKMEEVNVGYTDYPTYQEQGFRFDENLFNNCTDNTNLNGYFQSYKYFQHINDEIVDNFSFKHNYDIDTEYDVAIHVRRTDYVGKTEYHGLCSEEYYREALSYFNPSGRFVVMSDDIEWCMRQDMFSGFDFRTATSDHEDLYVMSKARNNIIANSSFSWWGAWLNKNPEKKVIAPWLWFNPGYIPIEDTMDLIPSDWIRL